MGEMGVTGMHHAGCQGVTTARGRLPNRAPWHPPRTTHVSVSGLQTLLAQSPLLPQSSPLGHFLLSEDAAHRPPQSVSVSKAASSALLAQMSCGSGVWRQGGRGVASRMECVFGRCNSCGPGVRAVLRRAHEARARSSGNQPGPGSFSLAATSPCHAVLHGSTDCTISRQSQKAWSCSPPVSAPWWLAGRSRHRCGQRRRWCTPGWRAAG